MKHNDLGKLLLVTAALTGGGVAQAQSTVYDETLDEQKVDANGNVVDDVTVDETTVVPDENVGATGTTSGTASDIGATRTGRLSETNPIGVELKPLPTLLSVVPGVGSIGAGVEGTVAPQVTAFLDAFFVDSNLPKRFDDKGEQAARDNDTVYPKKLTGRSADLGARFYGAPSGSTWYTGVKLGFASTNGEMLYKDNPYDYSVSSFTPGLQAGYRWLFDNHMLVRLGAVASANLVQSLDVNDRGETGEVRKQASDKIEDYARTPFIGNVDLGLGYQF